MKKILIVDDEPDIPVIMLSDRGTADCRLAD